MNRGAIFDDISIMGRVIYIIYVIEIYIKEREDFSSFEHFGE